MDSLLGHADSVEYVSHVNRGQAGGGSEELVFGWIPQVGLLVRGCDGLGMLGLLAVVGLRIWRGVGGTAQMRGSGGVSQREGRLGLRGSSQSVGGLQFMCARTWRGILRG